MHEQLLSIQWVCSLTANHKQQVTTPFRESPVGQLRAAQDLNLKSQLL
jgi:hypothetical protein